MADIHIRREHGLGLAAARKLAAKWAERVEAEFEMRCSFEQGPAGDKVSFSRSGVKGKLKVAKDHFELDAKLGLLLGAFKGRIEAEIVKNLDELLDKKPAAGKKA
ncbi:polyhydroxyalkanoic acid system family protein [Ramlibacter sp. 2FC]|uniref:polyhydroxyalkanoic acid system family protein n=1 Tax=Ramlibacter sp. 2FC TaxID=2502188 RepID=UPI0010F7A015|nr:polyhydroxyalkanoic acid system family protein [Ramlibacter sp. 2FC]